MDKGEPKCYAPKLTWDEIKNMAIYTVEEAYGISTPERELMLSDTLKRMGYPGGLSEDTFFDMQEEQQNG